MLAEIYWIQRVGTGRVGTMPRPRGGDLLADELRSLREQGVDVVVSLLRTSESAELGLADEEARCREVGIDFVSFPITDRSIPDSHPETMALARRLRLLAAGGKGVAIHCRVGVGRASLVAACVLILEGHSAEMAFARIAAARAHEVPDTAAQREWVERFALTGRIL
jgi:protein-tyrosine phosphatase